MTIKISTKDAIKKLTAFLAIRGKGQFDIPEELLDDVYESLRQFANDNRLRITLVQPNAARLDRFAWSGLATGGAVGYVLAALPGALTGMIVGYGVGLASAHLKITITRQAIDGRVIFDLC